MAEDEEMDGEGEGEQQAEIKETTTQLPVIFNLQTPGTLLMMLQVSLIALPI